MVFYTKFNEAVDDDGCFKFRESQLLIYFTQKINHDIETNLMSEKLKKAYGSMCKKGI